MSEDIPNKHLPFSEPLLETNFPRQMALASNPNVLIRRDGNANTTEGVHEVSLLLKELEDDYGIKNPGYNPIITGKNREMSTALTVTKKITGLSLAEAAESHSPKAMKKIAKLYDGLTLYLEDKANKKEKYLADIFGDHQYMYGHIDGEEEDNIY